jgi:hypothetical protein
MPHGRPSESQNKEALNALTDLYYLLGDLAAHVMESSESPQELDVYYVRPGGLKQLLHKYYQLASLDPQEAGSNVAQLTLERLLPFTTISQVTRESWEQIQGARGDLKEYNNAQQAYGTPVPPEVTEAVNKGKQILAKRTQRSRSGEEVVTVDLSSAVVSYEDHILIVGAVPIELEGDSIMDLVTRYMVVNVEKREQVYMDVISTWIAEESHGAIGEPSGRSIKDACRAVNSLFKAALGTEEDFFDTSIRHRVTRRY